MGMKSLRNFLLITSCAVIFSECAPRPMYSPSLYFGGNGYSEKQLDSTTYQVSFVDNLSTDEADRLALYRSAELTDQHGFDYFIVNDSREDGGLPPKPSACIKAKRQLITHLHTTQSQCLLLWDRPSIGKFQK
jgi:hypothetical protein